MKKTSSTFLIRVTAATLTAFCAGLGLNSAFELVPYRTHSRVPFTATVLTVFHDLDGTEIMRETVDKGYKSDGSVAASFRRDGQLYGRPAESAEFTIIKDVGSRMNFDVYPIAESVTSFPMSDEQVRRMTAQPDCTSEGSSWAIDHHPQPSTILGFKVVKRTAQLPAEGSSRASIHEEWLAPDLNCFPLRQVSRDSNAAVEQVRTSLEVVRVTLGPPDEAMFRIPPAFTERSPREIHEEIARRLGRPFESNHAIEMRTERYYKARSTTP